MNEQNKEVGDDYSLRVEDICPLVAIIMLH